MFEGHYSRGDAIHSDNGLSTSETATTLITEVYIHYSVLLQCIYKEIQKELNLKKSVFPHNFIYCYLACITVLSVKHAPLHIVEHIQMMITALYRLHDLCMLSSVLHGRLDEVWRSLIYQVLPLSLLMCAQPNRKPPTLHGGSTSY